MGSKSKFYSNFLLEKMEKEDEESKKLKNKNLAGRKTKKEPEKETETKNNLKRTRTTNSDDVQAKKKKKYDHIRKYGDDEISDEQPLLLSGGLMRDYQLKGYSWMATLYENGINGILADEMGLGKTIQTIALFAHLVEMGVPGPFLKFAPLLPTVLYHGSAKEREALRNKHLKAVHQL